MKHPKLKLFIIPILLFIIMLSLCTYITIVGMLDYDISIYNYDSDAYLILFLVNPIIAIIPSAIYYAFYIAYKKISKTIDNDEKISDKDKVETAKLDMLLRAHNKVMGNIDNK